MKKLIIIIISLLLVLSAMIMFISSNFFYNYLEKSNNKLCNLIFYFRDNPRFAQERGAKFGVLIDTIDAVVDDNFLHDFSFITNTPIWQKKYNEICKIYHNSNLIKDVYYIRNTNWCEAGYFITNPGKKSGYIYYCGWYSGSNTLQSTNKTMEFFGYTLNKNEFYKTNTIFREGLFKTHKLTTK